MYYSQTARLAIYAEGEFGKGKSKTAEGVIRYGRNPVVTVIDSTAAGKTVKEAVGIDCPAPIVASVADCLVYKPDALLLGTAWTGGKLPDKWRPDILKAIDAGLDVINGLHDFLSDDAEISALAHKRNQKLLDVRRPPDLLPVASGQALSLQSFIILTVGTDCSVGKMTVSLELDALAKRRGYSSKFVATGQTGIMIDGSGIAIDRVIGDFMAGGVEQMVMEAGADHQFVFVEGQGSLIHPGFSGVTLAILHGACPQALILCHKSLKTKVSETNFAIPKLSELVPVYESMAQWMRPAKVVGVALNTVGLSGEEARLAVEEAERDTGLPATDPVRFGAEKLLDAVLAFKEVRSGSKAR